MSLHLVIGQKDCLHFHLEELVMAAIGGGVTHVQLREKQATTREFLAIAQRLKVLLKTAGIPFIINDRVDIALALDADGVHLGQSDMPYPQARHLLKNNKIIGLTIETPEQMERAKQWDLQYVGVGPVFPTQTKLDAPEPLCLSGLVSLCKISRHPVIAIGGIQACNAAEVLNAGAQGIAVISAISYAEQPEHASRALKQIIQNRINK